MPMWLAIGTNITFTSPPPFCSPSPLPLSLFLWLLSLPLFYLPPSPSAPFALALSGLPSFVKSPEDQTGISGGVASFVCQATGEPKPRITWMKKGKKVSSQRFEVSTHMWLSDLTYAPTCTHINTSRHEHNTRDKTLQVWALDCPSLINADTSTHACTLTEFTQDTQSIALLFSITPTLLFSERDQTGFPSL